MNRRPRRNRKSETVRDMVAETELSAKNLIFPLFVLDGDKKNIEITSMPGIFRKSADEIYREIESCLEVGLKSFALFPVVEESLKDPSAKISYDKNFFYLKTIREIKQKFPETVLMTDVAMDPYSSHGHDGVYHEGKILNDETLPILGQMALAQAEAGADIIGPSDMMDGRVGFLRHALDENNFTDVSIMSYTAKYASSFYGPFREALDSAPKFGNKKTYQMDFRNQKEAFIEAELDISEGADIIMVKPALAYLDVISQLKNTFSVPIAAYNVSGEYAMVKASSSRGWIDEKLAVSEILTAIRRAGASQILTYFAKQYLRSL